MNQQGYADDIVKGFLISSIVWGFVAVLLGVLISFQISFPEHNIPPYLTYGRLRPIHTNAGIFGWGIGSFMAFFIYITQRLTRTSLWSPGLAKAQLWLFNVVIALAAVTLAMGMNRSKEYAELEWPVASLVVVLWVIFAVNIFMTEWTSNDMGSGAAKPPPACHYTAAARASSVPNRGRSGAPMRAPPLTQTRSSP